MWAFRWEGVIQTYFALERFDDVKGAWKRSTTEVRRARVVFEESLLSLGRESREAVESGFDIQQEGWVHGQRGLTERSCRV